MLQLNKNHWLIRTYEFLSGNYEDWMKPKSLCGLFWNVVLILLTSPFMLLLGVIGTFSESVKTASFGGRLQILGGTIIAYLLCIVAGTVPFEEEYLRNVSLIYFFLIQPLIGIVVITIICAIIGVIIFLVSLSLDAKDKLSDNFLTKNEKVDFIKGKICPRIKWK